MQGLARIFRIYCQEKAQNAQKGPKNGQKSALFNHGFGFPQGGGPHVLHGFTQANYIFPCLRIDTSNQNHITLSFP
jgi:hypothetical protein